MNGLVIVGGDPPANYVGPWGGGLRFIIEAYTGTWLNGVDVTIVDSNNVPWPKLLLDNFKAEASRRIWEGLAMQGYTEDQAIELHRQVGLKKTHEISEMGHAAHEVYQRTGNRIVTLDDLFGEAD